MGLAVPKFHITLEATHVVGWQCFAVEAASREEALQVFASQGGEYVDQELEIQELSVPDLGDVTEVEGGEA